MTMRRFSFMNTEVTTANLDALIRSVRNKIREASKVTMSGYIKIDWWKRTKVGFINLHTYKGRGRPRQSDYFKFRSGFDYLIP